MIRAFIFTGLLLITWGCAGVGYDPCAETPPMGYGYCDGPDRHFSSSIFFNDN